MYGLLSVAKAGSSYVIRRLQTRGSLTKSRSKSSHEIPSEALVARVSKHGDPKSVLTLGKESLKPVKDHEVLVKMVYAPINPSDLNIIQGVYPTKFVLPGIPGNEGVGKVIQVGKSVNGLKVDDMVIPGVPNFGTWRSHAVAPASDLIRVDNSVAPEYLAMMAINPTTALRLLNDFVNLQKGDVIIQNAANSTVGLAIVQMAAARGIKTINLIRQRFDYASMNDKIKQYGGYIVDTDTEISTPNFRRLISDLPKPKLALTCTGGPTVTEMVRLLEDGGTLVTYGAMARQPVTVPSSLFIFKDVRLRGFWLSKWLQTHSAAERDAMYAEITQMFKSDQLRLWSERHNFETGLSDALDRAQLQKRERKVLLEL